jgi:hypothetical protein
MQTIIHHQQMELHQAQAQYAAYSAMAVRLCFRVVYLVSIFFLHRDTHHSPRLGQFLLHLQAKALQVRHPVRRPVILLLPLPTVVITLELTLLLRRQTQKLTLPIGLFSSLSFGTYCLLNNGDRAAYGCDVNSSEFQQWHESQRQQYTQYYAAYAAQSAAGGVPGDAAAPSQPQDPPPPPPPPSS